MNIAIYGVEQGDLYRYNEFWLKNLKHTNVQLFLFCDEKITQETDNAFIMSGIKTVKVNTYFLNSKKIKNLLKKLSINVLILNALSVPDLRFLAHDHKNLEINYIQHGLYIPYMRRTLGYYFKKISKISTYFYYTISISKNWRDLYLIATIFTSGNSRAPLKKLYNRVDNSFVFSKYWEAWHRHHYKLKSQFFHIGSPDFDRFSLKNSKNAVIYCSQTLVEDGRIPKQIMFDFYQELKDYGKAKNKKIIVKIHPRNGVATIEKFKELDFAIEQNSVPLGDVAIGHYSSLLPIWPMNNVPLIVVELPGHKIPLSISKVANAKVKNLSHNLETTDVTGMVEYYFGTTKNIDIVLEKITQNSKI